MPINRREFIATSAFGVAAARFGAGEPSKLPLAFSTLACPAWSLDKILEVAQENGFAAIELRGLLGELNLPVRPEFATSQLAHTKRLISDHGLRIACVSSSAELHKSDPAEREKELAGARRFIDLASFLGTPYVRVFGNQIDGPKAPALARVSEGLHILGEYAGPRNVTILLESHGDFVHSPDLKGVLTSADSKNVALLWDAHHTFADGHEQPEDTVQELGPWIRHTHLKDSVPSGKDRKYVLTGQGDIPVQRQIQSLRRIKYTGLYCFEWEKVWHPELQDPEIAIPDFAFVASRYLQELR